MEGCKTEDYHPVVDVARGRPSLYRPVTVRAPGGGRAIFAGPQAWESAVQFAASGYRTPSLAQCFRGCLDPFDYKPRAVSPLPWELPSEEPSPPKSIRPGRPRKNETAGRGRGHGRSGAQGSAKSKAAGTFEMELQYTFSDDEAEERDTADLGGSQCPICNKYGSVRYLLPTCKHSFCKPCLQMWRRKHATCMTCRMVYTGWVKIFT